MLMVRMSDIEKVQLSQKRIHLSSFRYNNLPRCYPTNKVWKVVGQMMLILSKSTNSDLKTRLETKMTIE